MSRLRLPAVIVGVAVLIALLEYCTSAELAGSVLFTFPLVLCIRQRSKWLLWGTSAVASLLAVAAGIWSFHRIELGNPELINPWIASINRGLLVGSLLTLSTLIHLWINKSHQLALEAAELEQHKNRLTASTEQLENELMKFRAAAKARRKPVLLTVKQYQAFVGQLSDLHRTMVVTAMCSKALGATVRPRPRRAVKRLLWTRCWRKLYRSGGTRIRVADWCFRPTSPAAATMPDRSSRITSGRQPVSSDCLVCAGIHFLIHTGAG
jgi:hypothetical protein